MRLVIPCAGKGSRFAEKYIYPKPLIDIHGKTMIQHVMENLKLEDILYVLICQKEHDDKYNLDSIFKTVSNNYKKILVSELTEGAACTVLLSIDHINNDDELVIANSDQLLLNPDIFKNFIETARKNKLDGSLLTIQSNHPKWSYARTIQENGVDRVIEVAEKIVISSTASCGIYYFKHGKDFVKGATQMIEKNIRTNNEFYVCPVYNELILNNKYISAYNIDNTDFAGIGDIPALENFLNFNYKKYAENFNTI